MTGFDRILDQAEDLEQGTVVTIDTQERVATGDLTTPMVEGPSTSSGEEQDPRVVECILVRCDAKSAQQILVGPGGKIAVRRPIRAAYQVTGDVERG